MSREPLNIALRRKQEDRFATASRAVADHARTAGLVDFEHRSGRKMHDAIMRQRIAESNKALRVQVDDRRRRLAELLTAEKAVHDREIEASYESPDRVKDRMFAYARKLKEENEAARAALAAELEKKRFRNLSDVLRARASVITSERVALDRVAQLHEKQRMIAAEKEREAALVAAASAAAAAAAEKARVEAEAKRRYELVLKQALDAQVAVKTDVSAETKARIAAEDAQALREWKAAAEAAAARETARRAAAREEFQRVQVYNAAELGVKKAAAASIAEADKRDLKAALERESAAIRAEREAAERHKAETLEFRRKLEEQMAIAAEETGWMDSFYAEEAEKAWARRQATWDAEAAARAGLMKEVTGVRIAQMEDRAVQAAAEKARDEEQVRIWRADLEAAEAAARARMAERERVKAEHAAALKRQTDLRAAAAAKAKQTEYLEHRLQQREEKEYAAKVEALLAEPIPHAVHARKKTGLW